MRISLSNVSNGLKPNPKWWRAKKGNKETGSRYQEVDPSTTLLDLMCTHFDEQVCTVDGSLFRQRDVLFWNLCGRKPDKCGYLLLSNRCCRKPCGSKWVQINGYWLRYRDILMYRDQSRQDRKHFHHIILIDGRSGSILYFILTETFYKRSYKKKKKEKKRPLTPFLQHQGYYSYYT